MSEELKFTPITYERVIDNVPELSKVAMLIMGMTADLRAKIVKDMMGESLFRGLRIEPRQCGKTARQHLWRQLAAHGVVFVGTDYGVEHKPAPKWKKVRPGWLRPKGWAAEIFAIRPGDIPP
jgi:hypothetical protein